MGHTVGNQCCPSPEFPIIDRGPSSCSWPPHPSIHTKAKNLRISPETEHPQGLSLSVFKTLFSLSLFPIPTGILFCFRPMAAASSHHTNTKVTFGRPLSNKGSLYCFPAQSPSLAQLHSSLVPLFPLLHPAWACVWTPNCPSQESANYGPPANSFPPPVVINKVYLEQATPTCLCTSCGCLCAADRAQ